MSLIQEGIKKKLITISEDNKTIRYLHQDKPRNYTNPEEKVQAEAFLRLVLEYGYPVENIEQFKTVTMGADKREADIIVRTYLAKYRITIKKGAVLGSFLIHYLFPIISPSIEYFILNSPST